MLTLLRGETLCIHLNLVYICPSGADVFFRNCKLQTEILKDKQETELSILLPPEAQLFVLANDLTLKKFGAQVALTCSSEIGANKLIWIIAGL